METFAIINLGCKVNRVEADTAAAMLLAKGWQRVDVADADIVIVNTCTVTGEADKKCRKACRQTLSRNPHAKVLVTGCAAAINPDEFTALDERVRVIGRTDLSHELGGADYEEKAARIGAGFNTRVGIKIQDGCQNSCTYCIVHTARNELFSLPREDAVRQARQYFEAGVNELILTGINIGAYRDGNTTLADLMRDLLNEADLAADEARKPRFRLSSIEPRDVDDRLIDLMASSNGAFCRHLHIPLQAGSSKVLAEMNRPYTAEWYLDLVRSIRNRIPSISLSTDIIVGFPGETEDEFCETLALARACGFSKIHVFPYSMRAGTPAAERSDQVAPDVKTDRAKRLRTLSDELRHADFESRIGMHELALVETEHALTESYHEVAIPAGAQTGSLVEVVIGS